MYSEIYLRLEPLGLELVAESARRAGHEVRLLDLQAFRHPDYYRVLQDWKPQAIGFSLNDLANIPEVVNLAKQTKVRRPECFSSQEATALHSPQNRSWRMRKARLPASFAGTEKRLRPRSWIWPPTLRACLGSRVL
jgi:hypothetical protein